MDGSGEAYQHLMQRLAEALPDVAAQVRDEVARGRVVPSSKLSGPEREERETRMTEAKVGRLGKADVASVPYSDDERLTVLIDALIRTATTMRASREALLGLASEYGYDKRVIIFDEPDETARVEVALADEVQAARQVAETVDAELRPAADELQGAT
jgi:hypothetical protein